MATCFRCQKKCSKEELALHLESCQKITCPTCKTVFKNKAALAAHHKGETNSCSSVTTSPQSSQQKSTVKKKNYECTKCGAKFDFQGHLSAHVDNNCKKFACQFCKQEYQNPRGLQQHMRKKHANEPQDKASITCRQCGKVCQNSFRLREHEKTHADDYLTCSYCDQTFNSRPVLLMHINIIHLKKYAVKCKYCQLECLTKYVLKTHVQTKHCDIQESPKSEPPVFICEVCKKEFGGIDALKRHMHQHSSRMCEKCGKSVSSPYFADHMKRCEKKSPSKLTSLSKIICGLCDCKVQVHKSMRHINLCHEKMMNKPVEMIPETVDCSRCNTSFSVFEYASHLQAEIAKELFVSIKLQPEHCEECDAYFGTVAYHHHLLAHMGKDELSVVLKKIKNKNGSIDPSLLKTFVGKPERRVGEKRNRNSKDAPNKKPRIQKPEVIKFPCEQCSTMTESAAAMQEHYLKVHDEFIPIREKAGKDQMDFVRLSGERIVYYSYQCFCCGKKSLSAGGARFCLNMCRPK